MALKCILEFEIPDEAEEYLFNNVKGIELISLVAKGGTLDVVPHRLVISVGPIGFDPSGEFKILRDYRTNCVVTSDGLHRFSARTNGMYCDFCGDKDTTSGT